MTTTCNCGKPTRDNAYVCEQCLTDLARALGEVPWLDEQLDITITRQKGATLGGGARGNEKPLPYQLAASVARTGLRQAMFTWIKHCSEDHVRHQSGHDEWPADTLPAMSRWLMWRVDGLGLNDLGFDAVEEILSAVAHCRRVIDRPAERRFAGPCECGRDLYARPGASEATCRDCERTYNVEELRAWMQEQVRGRLVTAKEGAMLLSRFGMETKRDTVDKWRERGRLLERSHNIEGHRLYDFDDLLTLAARHAERSA